jgi:hypothetical protein
MKTLSALTFALALTACGTDTSSGGGATPQTAAPAAAAPAAPAAKDEHHSLAVADVAALPACDASAEGWLVYVKAAASFQACIGGAWQAIEIKGEKGNDGADGKNGTDGKDGAAGEKGEQGAKGESGSTVIPKLGDVFTDPDTGDKWTLLSGMAAVNEATCPDGWFKPDNHHGSAKFRIFINPLFATLATGDGLYWTDEPGTVPAGMYKSLDPANDTSKHMLACYLPAS